MKASQPKALEEVKPDFFEPKEVVHQEHMNKLQKAKAYVAEASKKRKAVEIKIPHGVILTTCPEKWDAHLRTLKLK